MQVHYGFEHTDTIRRPIATVGSYDGIHYGHRAILDRLTELARERHGESTVITFDPHPRTVVGNAPVALLTPLPEKLEILAGLGIDHTIVVPFTLEFSRMSYQEFVLKDLVGQLHIDTLLVGYNHHLGHNRSGGYDELLALSKTCGFDLQIMPQKQLDAHHVSSTVIRQLILQGQIHEAEHLLERAYHIDGVVDRHGAVSGIDPHKLIPAEGLYAVTCTPKTDKDPSYDATLSIGPDRKLSLSRPDFPLPSGETTIEFR